MKNINICIPTLNRYDLCQKAIDSFYDISNKLIPSKIFIMDNGIHDTIAYPFIINSLDISDLDENDSSIKEYIDQNDLCVFDPKINLGVAASWNWFIKNTSPSFCEDNTSFWIIANDDIIFYSTTLYNLVQAINKYPYMILGNGGAWSLMALHNNVISKIGLFDENFYPAYFEDNDYHHRMKLENLDFKIPGTVAYNHATSSTIKAYSPERMKKHHHDFKCNRQYFINKWGNDPTKLGSKLP